jgi:hypothetical protein
MYRWLGSRLQYLCSSLLWMLSRVEGQIISRTYSQEIEVSMLPSGVLDSTTFQQLLDIASKMSQELLDIAIRGIHTPRSWDLPP